MATSTQLNPHERSRSVWSALSTELADASAHAARAIVQVHGRSRPASGIVWAPERVVTTSHSVAWQDGVQVKRDDGEVLAATVVGHDAGSDLVLLKVPGLEVAPLATSSRAARACDLVLLTGRGWSGRQYARLVPVSALTGEMRTGDGTTLSNVLALPLGPFPGFSGGAVLAGDGLVAIATAGLARGRALAVPVALVRGSVEAIEQHGGVQRGFIGIVTQPVRLPARQRGGTTADGGLVVLDVSPDSPADAAGLLVGDIVIAAGESRLSSPEDLLAWLGHEQVGHELPLRIVRGGLAETVGILVAARPTGR